MKSGGQALGCERYRWWRQSKLGVHQRRRVFLVCPVSVVMKSNCKSQRSIPLAWSPSMRAQPLTSSINLSTHFHAAVSASRVGMSYRFRRRGNWASNHRVIVLHGTGINARFEAGLVARKMWRRRCLCGLYSTDSFRQLFVENDYG